MIRVKVYAPSWCNMAALDERGWMELPDGSTLADAIRVIHMPGAVARLLRASVNSEAVPLNTALKDGDVVGFFALMSGG